MAIPKPGLVKNPEFGLRFVPYEMQTHPKRTHPIGDLGTVDPFQSGPWLDIERSGGRHEETCHESGYRG